MPFPPRDDRTRPGLLFLAPMEGLTHPAFREAVAARGGVDVVCTEFVRVTDGPLSPRVVAREMARPAGARLSVQVMGNDAARMAEAAAAFSEAGADIIDVNLGCPMPRIVRKGVGAAMLRDLDLLARVLGAMRARVRGLFSAKIRAGWDDAAHVLRIAETVQASGCDFLVVHPRRRADFYEGVADWRIVALLARELRIPVVGNGDVWTAADALRLREEAGCDGVMIGRPAVRNPFIFAQAAALARGEAPVRPDGDMLLAALEDVFARTDAQAPAHRRGRAGPRKELLGYVARALPDREAFLRAVLRAADVDAIDAHVRAFLAGRPAERLDLGAHGELGLERSASARGANDAGAGPLGAPRAA